MLSVSAVTIGCATLQWHDRMTQLEYFGTSVKSDIRYGKAGSSLAGSRLAHCLACSGRLQKRVSGSVPAVTLGRQINDEVVVNIRCSCYQTLRAKVRKCGVDTRGRGGGWEQVYVGRQENSSPRQPKRHGQPKYRLLCAVKGSLIRILLLQQNGNKCG